MARFTDGGTGTPVGRAVGIAVVPGPESMPTGECSACGSTTAPSAHSVADGVELVLCLDFVGCAARYRYSVTPEIYAAALRGELPVSAP
jgi:hypothetical protein